MKNSLSTLLVGLFVASSLGACGKMATSTSAATRSPNGQASTANPEPNLPELFKEVNNNIKSSYTYEDLTVSDKDISDHKVVKTERDSKGKILSVKVECMALLHANYQYGKTLHECVTTATYNSNGTIVEVFTECQLIEE
jgi:hypothetical protein